MSYATAHTSLLTTQAKVLLQLPTSIDVAQLALPSALMSLDLLLHDSPFLPLHDVVSWFWPHRPSRKLPPSWRWTLHAVIFDCEAPLWLTG
jgi:hypothetical protein